MIDEMDVYNQGKQDGRKIARRIVDQHGWTWEELEEQVQLDDFWNEVDEVDAARRAKASFQNYAAKLADEEDDADLDTFGSLEEAYDNGFDDGIGEALQET